MVKGRRKEKKRRGEGEYAINHLSSGGGLFRLLLQSLDSSIYFSCFVPGYVTKCLMVRNSLGRRKLRNSNIGRGKLTLKFQAFLMDKVKGLRVDVNPTFYQIWSNINEPKARATHQNLKKHLPRTAK